MRLFIPTIFILGALTLHASTLENLNTSMRNKQISIYEVKPKNQTGRNGIGLSYNTQNLKLKLEESDTSFKTAATVHVNPFQTPMYLNIGANYMEKTIQQSNSLSTSMNQYSTGLAIGYVLDNNFYLELGGAVSELSGYQYSSDDRDNKLTTKDTYFQAAKRFETPIGTVDAQFQGSQIYKTLSQKEQDYGSNFNYYIDDTVRLNYFTTINQNEIHNGYSINVSYFTTEYTKNISQDSYNVVVKLKANFTDITNISSYKSPNKKKKRLSKSHKFDDMVLHDNMKLRM